jgi:hypothetical protein
MAAAEVLAGMNWLGVIFLLLNAMALLWVPRRWATIPLLVGTCWMTIGQQVLIGPFHFTILRLLILIGAIRALARGERLHGGLNALDRMLLMWGVWLLFSSAFHRPFKDALVDRLGLCYNAAGIYFLVRVFCQSKEDVILLIKVLALILVPLALEMVNEARTGQNLFAYFGGVPEEVDIRDGKFRAQGPFRHEILGGTVGALCVPLMVGIWHQQRLPAVIGLLACLGAIVASNSSGPVMTVLAGVFALAMWRWRHLTRQMRICAVIGYILLDIVMHDPAYFIMARIDFTGSSTGDHRALLIQAAIRHLREWWFAGTDYTAHWMVFALAVDPNHCDLTNHFLVNGVTGGLPLMMLLIGSLWLAFRYVGGSLRLRAEAPFADRFLIWSLGAFLFAHAVTGIGVAFFDQSATFLYLNLGVIGSLCATAPVAVSEQAADACDPGVDAGEEEPNETVDLPPEGDGLAARSVSATGAGFRS